MGVRRPRAAGAGQYARPAGNFSLSPGTYFREKWARRFRPQQVSVASVQTGFSLP